MPVRIAWRSSSRLRRGRAPSPSTARRRATTWRRSSLHSRRSMASRSASGAPARKTSCNARWSRPAAAVSMPTCSRRAPSRWSRCNANGCSGRSKRPRYPRSFRRQSCRIGSGSARASTFSSPPTTPASSRKASCQDVTMISSIGAGRASSASRPRTATGSAGW